ncbi:hypothetical protein O7627_11775 [Solwaraspora sp. WMMD1047]|uniref:tetratricopeptide repeat protein n=1 Tax=Solwaraspora sp. WMMD1047 TaxID=3016102 RepID=UPI0024173AD8|nr:tetratricopeptide repeat protein [Solwaraspora sp. WMMD1047]MDG4829977.1 hypothetical protein [Solwaraspora sp. WMMD1047]
MSNETVVALNDLAQALGDDEAHDDLVVGLLSDTVSMIRRLAMRHDQAVPILATLLDVLAGVHRRNLRAEVALPLAEEHVAIRRSLTAASADPQHRVKQARALAELSRTLSVLNRHHESLAAAQEAVAQVREASAAGHPALRELADNLSNLQRCLYSVARSEEALAAAQEAVGVEAQLRLVDPTGDPTRFAEALTDLASRLGDLERYSAAATAMQEAAALLRQLASEGSTDAQYILADALDSLGYYTTMAETWPEAVAACREAVAVRRRLPAREGTHDAVRLAGALHDLASALRDAGRPEQVAQVIGEAIVRYRPLSEAGLLAPGDLWRFATAVGLYRLQLVEAGQHQTALAPAREQVTLYRHLAKERPDRHLRHLAQALESLADILTVLGHHSEAAAAHAEAESIRSSAPI